MRQGRLDGPSLARWRSQFPWARFPGLKLAAMELRCFIAACCRDLARTRAASARREVARDRRHLGLELGIVGQLERLDEPAARVDLALGESRAPAIHLLGGHAVQGVGPPARPRGWPRSGSARPPRSTPGRAGGTAPETAPPGRRRATRTPRSRAGTRAGVCRRITYTVAPQSAPARSQNPLRSAQQIRERLQVVGHELGVLQQAVWSGLPAQPTPALELAAGVAQHTQLPGLRETRAEPVEIEIGKDQLEQYVRLPTEERRDPLTQPATRRAERPQQRPGILPHRERGGDSPGAGPRHEIAIGDRRPGPRSGRARRSAPRPRATRS